MYLNEYPVSTPQGHSGGKGTKSPPPTLAMMNLFTVLKSTPGPYEIVTKDLIFYVLGNVEDDGLPKYIQV